MSSHCVNCGSTDYHKSEGYTDCCNDLDCDGSYEQRWTDGKHIVFACCGAKAQPKFDTHGSDSFWMAR